MTLLEAVAHKTDFIAADVAGCKEIASDFGRRLWSIDRFSVSNLLSVKPKKITSTQYKKLKLYTTEQVETAFQAFIKTSISNKITLYDISNTNQFHRMPLLKAVDQLNISRANIKSNLMIVVSTRNMIKALPQALFGGVKTIINIVGFGRLYSDYGIFGRATFYMIVWLHDRTTAQAFIVEHENDKILLEQIVSKPVYTTHGSGLNVDGFSRKRLHKNKALRLGYLSRFHKSKGSHEILKVAQCLPNDRELIIAGWDINGDKYREAFQKISSNKQNVIFLGRLNSRKEVSKFFNSIDLFLSPSVREGGNIALQEAIWHKVPFLTTNVPGCDVLAKILIVRRLTWRILEIKSWIKT